MDDGERDDETGQEVIYPQPLQLPPPRPPLSPLPSPRSPPYARPPAQRMNSIPVPPSESPSSERCTPQAVAPSPRHTTPLGGAFRWGGNTRSSLVCGSAVAVRGAEGNWPRGNRIDLASRWNSVPPRKWGGGWEGEWRDRREGGCDGRTRFGRARLRFSPPTSCRKARGQRGERREEGGGRGFVSRFRTAWPAGGAFLAAGLCFLCPRGWRSAQPARKSQIIHSVLRETGWRLAAARRWARIRISWPPRRRSYLPPL